MSTEPHIIVYLVYVIYSRRDTDTSQTVRVGLQKAMRQNHQF